MKLFNNIWKPRSVVIVHLEFLQEQMTVRAGKIRAGQTDFDPEFVVFENVEAVIQKFGKYIPYQLHVDGSGVLTRLIEFLPGYKEQLIVNADKNDFYFCSLHDTVEIAVSFFRKSLIEEQLEIFKTTKAFLFGISCGVIPALLSRADQGTTAFDYIFQIENKRILKLERAADFLQSPFKQQIYRKRWTAIQEGLDMALFVSEIQAEEKFEAVRNEAIMLEFGQYLRFKILSIAVVSVILSSLVINYFYINHLNRETAQIEMDLMLSNDNLALLDRLKQEKLRKEQLVVTSGINSTEFISFYMDKIGASVPKSIVLKEMGIFPLKEKMKERKKLEIEQQSIGITGYTSGSESLDDWMEKINRFSWVKSVELLNYLKTENANAEFKLLITLAE